MIGEHYNSPNGSPETPRGLKASELLGFIATIDSLAALRSMERNIIRRMWRTDLDEDEKDLLVAIDFRIEKLKDKESLDIEFIREASKPMTQEQKHANFAIRALEARFNDTTFDDQLGIEEEARIARFKD